LLVTALLAFQADRVEGAVRVPFQRAVTVGEWGPTAYEPAATRALLDRLKRHNVDTVTLFVVWIQDGKTSTAIRPGEKTVQATNLVSAMRTAERLGLDVVLRPYVDRADNGWRGQIAPASVPRWFASYRRFIVRFASLAQRERAEGFVIGSEMVSLSGDESRWRRLALGVRKRFKGFVTYEANWDEAQRVAWWDALDAISISAYYPLTQARSYTTADLVRGWTGYTLGGQQVNWFADIEKLRARYRRPVIFGEIGYRTIAGAAMHPWDTGTTGRPTPAAQTRAYEAAFRVWYRVPWFRGFHWWYLSPQKKLVDGLPGADHRLVPATIQLLRRWYGRKRSG
jgi:hypothetical protein